MKRRGADQSSRYDKIIRENLEVLIPSLIEKVLDIHPVLVEEIPDDIQRTKERKPDALKRVTDQDGQRFILHLEFQVANDPGMVHRMHVYCALLLEKYNLPLRQFVIYVGGAVMNMTNEIQSKNISFRYELIDFQSINYKLFLSSTKAEEVVFAILGNPGNEQPTAVLEATLRRLNETADSALLFDRYREQLRVLVQLRNLQAIFDTVMDSVATFFKEEKDFLYLRGHQRGLEKGIEVGEQKGMQKGLEKGMQKGFEKGLEKSKLEIRQAKHTLVVNLLSQTDFDTKRIAQLTDVSIAYVQRLKRELKKEA